MTQIPRRRHNPADVTLSPAMEDYLKAIFNLTREGESASTQSLATRLEVSPASATKMMKRLAEARLVVHEPYQGVRLTESGQKIAVEILRHHRLLELYLTQALGYSWDEVHEEAERLEHYISEKLEARICEFLGNPSFDPHGSPIPTLDGELPQRALIRLDESAVNELYQVARVKEPVGVHLQELDKLGMVPGVTVVTFGRPPGGKVHLKIGRKEHLVEPALCRNILCRSASQECFPAQDSLVGERVQIAQLRGGQKTALEAFGLALSSAIERTDGGYLSLDTERQVNSEALDFVLVEALDPAS